MIACHFNKEYIEELTYGVKRESFDIHKILQYVCDLAQVDIEELKVECRVKKFVMIRQMMCKILKDNTKLSLDDIGSKLRNPPLNHSTVLHGVKSWNNEYGMKYHKYYDDIYIKTKLKFNLK